MSKYEEIREVLNVAYPGIPQFTDEQLVQISKAIEIIAQWCQEVIDIIVKTVDFIADNLPGMIEELKNQIDDMPRPRRRKAPRPKQKIGTPITKYTDYRKNIYHCRSNC